MLKLTYKVYEFLLNKYMKQKSFTKFCNVEVFKVHVLFVVCDKDDILKNTKKMMLSSTYEILSKQLQFYPIGAEDGKTFCFEGGGSLIWMPKYNSSILVHEIFHATHHALEAKGFELTKSSHEAYAYCMEYVYEKLSS